MVDKILMLEIENRKLRSEFTEASLKNIDLQESVTGLTD